MAAWILFLMAFAMFGLGYWQLMAPIDALWQRHERYLLARGLSPQRSEVWERSARNGGWFSLGVGFLILLMAGVALSATSPATKMSGVSINGRELTQQQWDSCGHDTATCLSQYYRPN